MKGCSWAAHAVRAVSCLLAATLVASAAGAQVQVAEVSSDGAVSGDGFGTSLGLSGDTLVVGVPQGGAGDAGFVSVLERSGDAWLETAIFPHPTGQPGTGYGASVAVDGALAVAGLPLLVTSGKQGRVAVWRREAGAWSAAPTLFAAGPNDAFGTSVALRGGRLAVGAPHAGVVGAVSLYEWSEPSLAFLPAGHLPAPADIGFAFGTTVDVDGDVLVVGDPDANGVAPGSGLAWIYERHPVLGWQLAAQLAPFVATPANVHLGAAVAVRGTRVAVTATGSPQFGAAPGATFVYERTPTGWTLAQTITVPGFGPDVGRGASVGLAGDVLVVGAPDDDLGFGPIGSAQVYRRFAGTWQAVQTLAAEGGALGDGFGTSLALEGTLGAIGAPSATLFEGGAGVAYVFAGVDPWTDEGGALAGAAGAPRLDGQGALTPLAPTELSLDGAAPNAPLVLLVGFGVQSVPFKGGTLVPTVDLKILGLATNTSGALVLGFAWPAGFPSGFGTTLQAWIADAGAPAGWSATNGLTGTTP